ncbi:MAG TPA: substrate-binding domain-containing protein [Candidatus Cybelea sp.]|nr:substrate-binding domain-containing protein [Candidatus Cybelea sp.]
MGGCCGCLISLFPILHLPRSAPVIAFVPRTTGTIFTEDMHWGAQAAAQSAGYRIYWNAPTTEDDLDRQIVIAENAVARGAKALILGPSSVWGVTTMVNSLVAQKVPVVFVQTGPAEPTGPYLTAVTPNQSQFGALAAARIGKVTRGTGQVAIVGIDRGTPETLSRAESFIRAISAYPDIKVVAQSPGAVQILEAEQSTRELVSRFRQLRAIFALTADATQGAMVALQEIDALHKITLVGSDRDLFLTDSLRNGKLDSLVSADGYRIGFLAVRAALVRLNGSLIPPPQYVSPELLTPANPAFSNGQ